MWGGCVCFAAAMALGLHVGVGDRWPRAWLPPVPAATPLLRWWPWRGCCGSSVMPLWGRRARMPSGVHLHSFSPCSPSATGGEQWLSRVPSSRRCCGVGPGAARMPAQYPHTPHVLLSDGGRVSPLSRGRCAPLPCLLAPYQDHDLASGRHPDRPPAEEVLLRRKNSERGRAGHRSGVAMPHSCGLRMRVVHAVPVRLLPPSLSQTNSLTHSRLSQMIVNHGYFGGDPAPMPFQPCPENASESTSEN
jgi:hypothetical protein